MSANLTVYAMAIAAEHRLRVRQAERWHATQADGAGITARQPQRGGARLAARGAGLATGLILFGLLAAAAAAGPSSTPTCDGKAATIVVDRGTTPLDQEFVQPGTDRDDVIVGTDGKDLINAAEGNDVVCGLGGDDSIYGGAGDDVLRGGAGDDVLGDPSCNPACPSNDRLYGGRGSDLLAPAAGTDLCDGGKGKDRARYRQCETKRRVEGID